MLFVQQLLERTLSHTRFGEYVTEFFNSNVEMLDMIDPSLSVEMSFFLYLYEGGTNDILHSTSKDILPAQRLPASVVEVIAEVERLEQQPAYILCSYVAQGDVSVVCEWIHVFGMGNPRPSMASPTTTR